MPLTYGDIKELSAREIEYIKLIQNDLTAFIEHISLNDKSSTRSFIAELVKRNADIIGTDLYKDFKKDTLFAYRQNVKKGKVKIANTDYCVICSNVYEMLLATVTPDNSFEMNKQLLHGYEIYTPRYEDGADIVGFRNPHIATGNVLLATNKYYKQFDSFFNLTDNIVIINAIRTPIFDRLQGNDMDSDTVLLSINPTLLKRATKCQNYLTPVNRIDAEKDNKLLTGENKSSIDYIICQNKIGDIVNLSQIYNSIYWHKKKEKADTATLNEIYNQVSQLSSLSQIEIDKAKKFFDPNTLNTGKYTMELYRQLKDRPMFFKVIQKIKEGREYKSYNCPMDYLQKEIDSISRADNVDSVDIFTLLSATKTTPNKNQIKMIKELVNEADKKINAIHKKEKKSDEDKDKIKRIENDLVSDLSKMKLSVATVQDIIRRMYSEKSKDEEINKYKMLLLKTIAKVNMDSFIKAFTESTSDMDKALKCKVKIDFWNNI